MYIYVYIFVYSSYIYTGCAEIDGYSTCGVFLYVVVSQILLL